jgi:chromosome segregation ATPase
MSSKFTALFAFLLATHLALRADDEAATTESRLRQALRDTTLQLRDAQNQIVTLETAQEASDAANKDLQAKVDSLTSQVHDLTKQSADDKAAADQAIAALNAKVADQSAQIARLTAEKDALNNDCQQQTLLAAAKEAARAQLALQVALLQRTVDDREYKNLQLYKTGNEILTRYEKFSLGDALAAKEPFVGLTRVKLENLVQDYKDKLLNETVTPGQPPSAPPAGATGTHEPPPPKQT